MLVLLAILATSGYPGRSTHCTTAWIPPRPSAGLPTPLPSRLPDPLRSCPRNRSYVKLFSRLRSRALTELITVPPAPSRTPGQRSVSPLSKDLETRSGAGTPSPGTGVPAQASKWGRHAVWRGRQGQKG